MTLAIGHMPWVWPFRGQIGCEGHSVERGRPSDSGHAAWADTELGSRRPRARTTLDRGIVDSLVLFFGFCC